MSSNQACAFVVADYIDGNGRCKWTCSRCGFTTPMAHTKSPLRVCDKQTASTCDQLGKRIIRISGDVLDCKHRSITLYQCERYHVAVTLMPVPIDHAEILKAAADSKGQHYTSESCDKCAYRRHQLKDETALNTVKQG